MQKQIRQEAFEVDGHSVEVTGRRVDPLTRSGQWRFVTASGDTDHQTYKSSAAAYRAAKEFLGVEPVTSTATAAPAPATSTGDTGWSRYSRRRGSQAKLDEEIGQLFGIRSEAVARGDCHYCGQPLNRAGERAGECDECV